MTDPRLLLGEEDNDPPASPADLPSDFDQVLAHRLRGDWDPPGDFWPPESEDYSDEPPRSWPEHSLIECADRFPGDGWPPEADVLYRLLANRYRGYAQFVFGEQVGDLFPDIETAARAHLANYPDIESLEVQYPYSAHIGFSRAIRSIRWDPFPYRHCPLCLTITNPNRMPGTFILQQAYPPRWCLRCTGVTHRVPTQKQAVAALQYFVNASGFVPFSYSEVFRIPPGIQGSKADKIAAGRMSIPFPAMVNRIGLGPWNSYLEHSGLLGDHVPTARGVQSRALDGHWTLSLLERSIDDFMTRNRIEHTHEPPWPRDPVYNPRGRLRADWQLADGTLVEAAGMMANKKYASTISTKRKLASRLDINLIVITPADLNRLDALFLNWLPATKESE